MYNHHALELALKQSLPGESEEVTLKRAEAFAGFLAADYREKDHVTSNVKEGPVDPSIGSLEQDIDIAYEEMLREKLLPVPASEHVANIEQPLDKAEAEFASDAYDRGWNDALDRLIAEVRTHEDDRSLTAKMVREFVEPPQVSDIAKLLHEAVDLLDAKPADPLARGRELAEALDPEDFKGADPDVRIGLNYLKGRMQNLEDDLDRARAYAVDLNEKLAQERRDHQQTHWLLTQAKRELATCNDHTEEGDFTE